MRLTKYLVLTLAEGSTFPLIPVWYQHIRPCRAHLDFDLRKNDFSENPILRVRSVARVQDHSPKMMTRFGLDFDLTETQWNSTCQFELEQTIRHAHLTLYYYKPNFFEKHREAIGDLAIYFLLDLIGGLWLRLDFSLYQMLFTSAVLTMTISPFCCLMFNKNCLAAITYILDDGGYVASFGEKTLRWLFLACWWLFEAASFLTEYRRRSELTLFTFIVALMMLLATLVTTIYFFSDKLNVEVRCWKTPDGIPII